MDPQDVGSLWTIYFFWCAACDPLAGIVIDVLQSRGFAATWLLLCVTPLWAYVMRLIWAPAATAVLACSSWDSCPLLVVLLPFGLLQATQMMLISAVLASVFPAGPKRRAASLARQTLGIVGLLVGMVGPPYVSADWTDRQAMPGGFVWLTASAVVAGSVVLAALGPGIAETPSSAGGRAGGGVTLGGGGSGGADKSGLRGLLQGPRDILHVLLYHVSYRQVLLFSVASNFGNALFATSIGIFNKHVAR